MTSGLCLFGLAACMDTQTLSYGTSVETTPTGEVRFRSNQVVPLAQPHVTPNVSTISYTPQNPSAPAYGALPNRTKVPGPNTLTRANADLHGTGPEALLRAAGPLPSPFEFLLATDLRATRAPDGALLYFAPRFVSGTYCVLGLRPAPEGTGVMVLRNCVPGGQGEALAPLLTGTTY